MSPLVPAKAGTQLSLHPPLDSRLRGNERNMNRGPITNLRLVRSGRLLSNEITLRKDTDMNVEIEYCGM